MTTTPNPVDIIESYFEFELKPNTLADLEDVDSVILPNAIVQL